MRAWWGLLFAILSMATRASASPPEPPDDPDATADEEPELPPECSESPDDVPSATDVAIMLGHRGLDAGRPVEMACEGTWLHYCPPLQASLCAASSLSAIDTSRVDRVPIELFATTATTVTFDGTAFKLKGTHDAPDRRAFTIDISRRHAQVRTSPGGRAGQLPLPLAIAGPSEGRGELLVSVPGMLPELAGYAGGPLRWAGESKAAAPRAKAVLFVEDGEIVSAYPRDFTGTLGDVRYLARVVLDPHESLCDVSRHPDVRARTARLVVHDRITGKVAYDHDLPPLVHAGPCTRDVDRSWPSWPSNAFAPEIARALDGVLASAAPAWPRFDGKSPRAALTRIFGMTAPTVAELARVLGDDRTKLATALDTIYGPFESDGPRLTELSLRLESRDQLVRMGLRDPVMELIGKPRAALTALLGPPDGDAKRNYLDYPLTSGAATVKATIVLDDDIVTRVTLRWTFKP